TLASHSQRLAALEKQTTKQSTALVQRLSELATALRDTGREQNAALAQVAHNLGAQTQALAGLQEGEKHLLRLQETLNHNMASLNASGAFEQAVHSLTAAIHLLTARTGTSTSGTNRLGNRPGTAA